MKNYKWLGIVIIIIILVVGAYWFGHNSNNQTSSANIPTANNTSTQQASIPATQQTGGKSPTQQVVGIALQKQCSSDAQSFFDQWETTNGRGLIDSGGKPSYLSHYNSSLDKCFVEISGLLYIHDAAMGYFSDTYLYDVYGRNEIATMEVNSENNSFLCDFQNHNLGDTPNYCESQADFSNGINVYMSG